MFFLDFMILYVFSGSDKILGNPRFIFLWFYAFFVVYVGYPFYGFFLLEVTTFWKLQIFIVFVGIFL